MAVHILGINAFHADASAVLLRDGEVVGAIAEERLNRVKHYAGFPKLAVRELLAMGGIRIEDVNHLALGRDAKANLQQKLTFSLTNLPRLPKLARQRLENRMRIADVPSLLREATGGELRAEVHHVEHHLCHAASAFLPSPFERAAILSIDGFGDFASTMFAVGEGRKLRAIDRVHFPHSLGIFYTALCQLIGYDRYGDEGKVMGLAPYGEPTLLEAMREIVRERPDGKFELDLDYFVHHREGVDYGHDAEGHPTVAPLYAPKLVERLGPPRRRDDELGRREMDIARSLQARLEELYMHVLRGLHAKVGGDALCVAGGVSLNSVANGKIFAETPFRRFYAHPAATDDGTAFGAAYYVHSVLLGLPRPSPLESAYLGPAYDDETIAQALAQAGFRDVERLPDDVLYARTARAIAEGKVVGWFQGRMEWGPRALGARSIVAHPGLPTMKDTLNARIKHREWFRPFAPSILEERVGEYFDEVHPSPFMMLVYGTRPEKRAELVAVDHVDHTGRLQTVSARACPRYHALISAFERETGIPLVLNTSFNENEPIVCTPGEALACFTRTHMDALALGNYFLEKGPAPRT